MQGGKVTLSDIWLCESLSVDGYSPGVVLGGVGKTMYPIGKPEEDPLAPFSVGRKEQGLLHCDRGSCLLTGTCPHPILINEGTNEVSGMVELGTDKDFSPGRVAPVCPSLQVFVQQGRWCELVDKTCSNTVIGSCLLGFVMLGPVC